MLNFNGNIIAKSDSPPVTQSRFDGFALGGPTESLSYKITTNTAITAGDNGKYILSRGDAIPIMTGAPLPEGTSQIVPFEMCQVNGQILKVEKLPSKERMVLKKGSDFSKGQKFLKRGEKINQIESW